MLTADHCSSYWDTDGYYHSTQKCGTQHCCGNCNHKYCCSEKKYRLTEEEQGSCPRRCAHVLNLFFNLDHTKILKKNNRICNNNNIFKKTQLSLYFLKLLYFCVFFPRPSFTQTNKIPLILGAVLGSIIPIIFCVSLIICCVAPCCLFYKKCRKGGNRRHQSRTHVWLQFSFNMHS